MKKLLSTVFVMIFLMAVGGTTMASVINSPNVGGFSTFQDQNTGRIWLDMDNFFNQSTTAMVAAATAAGFTFANLSDVQQLLNSLPLTGGEWPGYKAVMGAAPNRELIWGSYFETPSIVGWAWSFNYDTSWQYASYAGSWSDIPNNPNFALDTDMNIWAYQSVPVPGTILLLGSGLAGLAGFRRRLQRS
jgi:hypothetical protein